MARLPRLALAGHTHLVLLRAHGELAVFDDTADRLMFLHALRQAAADGAVQVQVHAWALPPTAAWLLLTPADAPALSRVMQALGRRFVAAWRQRHGGRGTLWDGRFRAAVLEPGPLRLAALQWLDGLGAPHTPASATARGDGRGGAVGPGPALHDPPEFWALGNTPFEREAAWRARLAQGLPAAQVQALHDAALGGWALGSAAFAAEVAALAQRPAQPRPRGRPRRTD